MVSVRYILSSTSVFQDLLIKWVLSCHYFDVNRTLCVLLQHASSSSRQEPPATRTYLSGCTTCTEPRNTWRLWWTRGSGAAYPAPVTAALHQGGGVRPAKNPASGSHSHPQISQSMFFLHFGIYLKKNVMCVCVSVCVCLWLSSTWYWKLF